MRDPYNVLGLAKTASAAEIKSAFRKLAKKFHPDQSKEPKAKERFAEIGQAYEIIGDEKKRGAFDRGEIDAEGKPRAPQFEGFSARARGGGGDFRNFHFDFDAAAAGAAVRPRHVLRTVRRRRRAAALARAGKGEDVAVAVTVPLAQVATGGDVRVTLPTGKTLDVAVPVGFEDGKAIRLRGQGEPSARGGAPGRRHRDVALCAASAVQGRGPRFAAGSADHALRGGAGRQGARADACRARSRSPFRRRPAAAVCCGCAARACRRRAITRRAICS